MLISPGSLQWVIIASALSTSVAAPSPNTTLCDSGLSNGAVVGVGIGAAFGGGLVILLGVFIFLVLQRRRRESNHYGQRYSLGNPEGQKSATRGRGNSMDDLLGIPAAESEIKKLTQSLAVVIENHVDNFYHLKPLDIELTDSLPAIKACGYDGKHWSKVSAEDYFSLLVAPTSRHAAIAQLITQVVVAGMSWDSLPDRGLLPEFLTRFCRAMPKAENKPGSREELSQTFIKWRHLSAYLLSTWRSNREAPKLNDEKLAPNISANIALIDAVLIPFLKAGHNTQQQQEDNLKGIIRDAAELGFLLFCQPSIWTFDWTLQQTSEQLHANAHDTSAHGKQRNRKFRGNGGKKLVVFPAIGEETYKNGRLCWRSLEDAVVVDLKGSD